MTFTAEKKRPPLTPLKSQPATVAEGEAAPPWVMPKARLGLQIAWWRTGKKDHPHGPEIAYVIKVGEKAIELKTASGQAVASVPHIDDPRNVTMPDRLTNGAWDYIEADKQLYARLDSMETRLQELYLLVTELSKKPS